MDKYTFASVLKEHITESKLSIASLSRLSDVNRTMIQKYISGTQLPANHEILKNNSHPSCFNTITKSRIASTLQNRKDWFRYI